MENGVRAERAIPSARDGSLRGFLQDHGSQAELLHQDTSL
jgi:hypothetical protein